MDRRQFVVSSAAAAVSAPLWAQGRRTRMAIVGTGVRAINAWGVPIVRDYSGAVEIVGLCDINGLRVKAAQELIGTQAPTYVDFEKMLQETKPQLVVVSSIDGAHRQYVVRALELGLRVICETPMCTDEAQVQAVLDAVKKTRREKSDRDLEEGVDPALTCAFPTRYRPAASKIKQLLMERAIGDVISVEFHYYLDTSHGASFFRRWHHLKENSGTLLVTDGAHFLDLVNWWLSSNPVEVSAEGDLKVYGRNGTMRSTHCRVCPFKQQCRFYWDVMKNPFQVKLYVGCESEDGYFLDGCVFREDTNIYDSMSMRARYENGVMLTYLANAYLPYEGQIVAINGAGGRIDWNASHSGGSERNELRLSRAFGKSEVLTLPPSTDTARADSMRALIFGSPHGRDVLGFGADARAGANAALLGIAGYRSIERGGEKVKISSLVRF